MLAALPSTPRGRSRFKMFYPQEEEAASQKSPTATALLLDSPLPPLPQEKMPASMTMARQPVAATKHARESSLSSGSDYSETPGLSQSLSDSSSNHERDSLSGFESEAAPTPPPKHDGETEKGSILENPINLLSSSVSNFNSFPQTELWQRRSQKSDRSIVVPELKLDKSNGSTASPPQRKELPSAPDRPTLPRSLRGRKPVPVRPAPPQPDLMGNRLAKLKSRGLEDSSSGFVQDEASAKPYLSLQPLQIPESLNTDREQSRSPNDVSPLSPFTLGNENPPDVPRKSESRATSSAAASKSSEASQTSESTTRPNLLSPHSRQPSETLTITSDATVMRSPQPHKPVSTPSHLTPRQSPHRRTPSLATDFPAFPSIDDGAISTAPPLELTHFECYHFHKYMRSSKNTSCPVACMICQKQDTEMRWRCTWCCLSACRSCMQVLSSIPGKDLSECLERMEK